jgi:type I restriction enzyme S subunit
MRQQIRREAQGSKVYGISPRRLADVNVCFPAEEAEQRKIAASLTSLDELLAAEGRKLEALRAHKKGLMQQLFPREGESRPRLRFPEFHDAGEWETKKIGDVFATATGGTPERKVKAYWNGGIPWVTTSLVDFNVIRSTEETISAEGLYGQGKTRGKVAMLGIEAATNQACAAILPSDDVDQAFAFMNLAGRYDEIRAFSNAGGQENLSQGLIQELPFCYPEESAEQQRIAACLSSLDRVIAAASRKLDGLRAHKKGLMQQLFPSPEGV